MSSTNLNQVIIETIEQSKAILGEGFDFLKKETPLLIQEFLRWKFWEHLIWGSLCLLTNIVLLYFAFKFSMRIESETKEANGGWLFLSAICLIFLIPFTVGLFNNVLDALKITIAPRLYLLEYAIEAAKN